VVFEIIEIALIEVWNFFSFAVEKQSQHLLQPIALEQFQSSGAQARALDKKPPLVIQQSGIFHLVAKHSRITPVELQINACRKQVVETCPKALFFRRGATRVW